MNARGSFDGVRNILRFNWPTYVTSIAVGVAALAVATLTRNSGPEMLAALVVGIVPLLLVGTSLGASWWVYDHSTLYRWEWLPPRLPRIPTSVINVHAGFDETSATLRSLFPDATFTVLDFYDPQVHTEPSIARARSVARTLAHSIRAGAWNRPSATGDLIVCCFAAHEIRQHFQRVSFFREAARVVTPTGRIVLVEHQRDLPNFVVFGPGAFHFLSARSWDRAIADAGLTIESVSRITPFVSIRILKPTE